MTQAKHTPGPWWTLRTRSNLRVSINGKGWTRFAKVVVRMNDADHDSDEGLANARLIAAAPELLEALRELNAALNDGLCNSGIPGFDSGRLGRAQDAATVAIAKAEGQS
jgi:hypothetical protein